MIEGDVEEALTTHQLRASRLYARLDPHAARALAAHSRARRAPDTCTADVNEAVEHAAQKLAQFILEETNDGRHIVLFLLDVMDGNPAGSRLHHRLAAGLELMRRCFDRATAPCRHANANDSGAYDDSGAVGADPATETEWRWKPEWTHFEYPEDDTYDFSIYGEDEYDRDTYGDKALVHIFGDDETKSASNQAVLDYQVDRIEAHRAAGHSDLDALQPAPGPPDDDAFGQDTYGYNALLYIYGSKAAARAGYTAAMDHEEKLRIALLAAADAHDTVEHELDHPANGPDPPTVVPA